MFTNDEARTAAEALLQHTAIVPQNDNLRSLQDHQRSQVPSISPSLNSLDRLPSESVLLGSRNNGRMSIVRRFFCLFVLFDFLLISLAWFIWLMLTHNEDVWTVIKLQVMHYTFKYSTFDIVVCFLSIAIIEKSKKSNAASTSSERFIEKEMSAGCRFTVLLLFYGLLESSSRVYVATATAGTCLFIIPKISYFKWSEADQPVLLVLIFLISFILSWGEAWFLDFRVLPQEAHAQEYLARVPTADVSNVRASQPLRTPFFPSEAGSTFFYSPMESPHGSDTEEEEAPSLAADTKNLRIKGKETAERAWTILMDSRWTLEKSSDELSVFSTQVIGVGKYYKLKFSVHHSIETVTRELFDNISEATRWNRTLTTSKRIQLISEDSDIIYQVTAPAGKGMISSRDLVILRYKTFKESKLLIAGISIQYAPVPKLPNMVRAEARPSCWSLEKFDGSCSVECLISIDLKGWISKHLIHQAMIGNLYDTGKYFRQYLNSFY